MNTTYETRKAKNAEYALMHKTIPLGPWLCLSEAAGVRYIPAIFSQPFPVIQIGQALDGAEASEFISAIEWIESEVAREKPVFDQIHVDDGRVFDCCVTDPQRLCYRPWIEPTRVDGYPVEFRAFFGPMGYQGISSYYPQRPLPGLQERIECPNGRGFIWRSHIVELLVGQVFRMANKIYDAADGNVGFPVGCSMDFLLADDGRMWFLEGGPSHTEDGGAHPCCFPPGKIAGVALEAQEGAIQ